MQISSTGASRHPLVPPPATQAGRGPSSADLPALDDRLDLAERLDQERATTSAPAGDASQLRDTFQDFVGQTFFAEMIKSLRSSQKGAAYFNGGRAEEIFQGQFDQQMAEHLSDASAKTISDPMFELFQLGRAR